MKHSNESINKNSINPSKKLFFKYDRAMNDFLIYKNTSKTHLRVENWESMELLPTIYLLELYRYQTKSALYFFGSFEWVLAETYRDKLLCEIHRRIEKNCLTTNKPDDCILY